MEKSRAAFLHCRLTIVETVSIGVNKAVGDGLCVPCFHARVRVVRVRPRGMRLTADAPLSQHIGDFPLNEQSRLRQRGLWIAV
jgi:hypothetical protein